MSTDTAGHLRIRRLGVRVAPGVPEKSLVIAEDFTCPVLVEGIEQGDLWEPFARSDLCRAITLATDTHNMCLIEIARNVRF